MDFQSTLAGLAAGSVLTALASAIVVSRLKTQVALLSRDLETQVQQRQQLQGEAQRALGELTSAREELGSLRQQVGSATASLEDSRRTAQERLESLKVMEERLQNQARELGDMGAANSRLDAQLQAMGQMLASSQGDADLLRDQVLTLEGRLQTEAEKLRALAVQLADAVAHRDAALEARDRMGVEFDRAQAHLKDAFQNLAQSIFDEKGQKFAAQNQANLDALLQPLREQIGAFQTKVEDAYANESRERFSMQKELDRLLEMNSQLSADARSLTEALKGSNTAQGAWGELVLERLLESAGLERGREYEVQVTIVDEESGKRRPDAVLYLPENRHMVVDSKVSLVAYERWCSASDEDTRAKEIKSHVASLRAHLQGLADKSYEALEGLSTPDFVLMFIPIEGAFSAALNAEPKLFGEAYQRKVLITSPTTLLVVLRMVAHLWKQDKVSKSTASIVEQGRLVYDKLRGFLADFEQVGKSLKQAGDKYEEARLKLSMGKGNLVDKVEKLTRLGVSPAQRIPQQWLGSTEDDPEALTS